jgi:hypothetical protein
MFAIKTIVPMAVRIMSVPLEFHGMDDSVGRR